MTTKKQPTVKTKAPVKKRVLDVRHFQTPEMLVEWVNKNDVKPFSIVTFDRFHAVYFYH